MNPQILSHSREILGELILSRGAPENENCYPLGGIPWVNPDIRGVPPSTLIYPIMGSSQGDLCYYPVAGSSPGDLSYYPIWGIPPG